MQLNQLLNKIPNKLPRTYVRRVLDRLLPRREETLGWTPQALLELAHKKQELQQLILADPVRFFRPEPGGQWDFMTYQDSRITNKYFFAGNKSGKTTAAAILSGERVLGRPLWGRDFRKYEKPVPARICAFAEDFTTHEETTLGTFLTWFPKQYIRPNGIDLNPSGNVQRILFTNGSIMSMRTYEQGFAKAEGKDWDFVWCDEPPPRNIHTAIVRGLVAAGGELVISATLLSEPWLYDELELSHVKIFDASIHDNSWLTEQAKSVLLSTLTDAERLTRETGKPYELSGKVYSKFRDDWPWVIEIPPNDMGWDPLKDEPWPTIMAVDPHERKPLFILWGWLTPENDILWYDYDRVPSDSIKSVFERLKAKERIHATPTRLVIMDPNRGPQRQIDGQSWQGVFEDHEYDVLLGDDNMHLGHSAVKDMLDYEAIRDDLTQEMRLVRPPRMRFTMACRGKGGPIDQLNHYMWDNWSRGIAIEKDIKEKVKELHKDFPDCIRYAAMAGLDFNQLMDFGMEPLQLFRRAEGRIY